MDQDEEFEEVRAEFLQLLDLDILDIEAPDRMPMDRPDLIFRIPPVARALAAAMTALERRIKDDELQGTSCLARGRFRATQGGATPPLNGENDK